jgi:DNA-binding transcriptional regulator YdaS (Cro superfamily)
LTKRQLWVENANAMNKTAIERVFEIVGSEAEVARRLQVSAEAVRKWKRQVPPVRARQLEELTRGEVTRYDLCPDVFGDPPAPKPAAGSEKVSEAVQP